MVTCMCPICNFIARLTYRRWGSNLEVIKQLWSSLGTLAIFHFSKGYISLYALISEPWNSDFPFVAELKCLTKQWSLSSYPTSVCLHLLLCWQYNKVESGQPGECQGNLCFKSRTQRRLKIKLHAFTSQPGGCYTSSTGCFKSALS